MSKATKFTYRDNHIRSQQNRRDHLSFLCIAGCFLLGFFCYTNTGLGRCLWDVGIPTVDANSPYPTLRLRNKQGIVHDDDHDEGAERQRRLLQFGRSFVDKNMPADEPFANRRNHRKEIKECLISTNASKQDFHSEEERSLSIVRNVKRSIPTPWPINIIQERWSNRRESPSRSATENHGASHLGTSPSSSYPSMGVLALAYAKQQALIGFRQVSEISAQIFYNLPPGAPPLILLASIPRNVKLLKGRVATPTEAFRRIIPVFSDPFARSIVLGGLGMAVVSWSNQELQRKRKLTPLPLSAMSDDQGVKGAGRVSRVFLPPFLPEDVPEPEIDALRGATVDASDLDDADGNKLAATGFEENVLSNVSPKIRRHLNDIYETTTTTSRRFFRNYYSDWLQGRAVRKREVAKIRRNRIFDELVALQALKKRQTTSINKFETKASTTSDSAAPELGYALVTGASRGIGRAIAVELARWEIPLVLVARDGAKLAQLASDLEACYGVKCCVLEADLSKASAAEKIHQATTEAGISVDILINNAGVASEGLAIDTKTSLVERMVMLNSLTFTKLSVLYGRDMKKKRRGRILMMSSMAGLCNASPNTAVYGACKAFGKSLALSMAKEMETYGVGVTCLIPGAVSDTDFRANSGTRKALCWYLPFYSRSADIVAHQGVVSLLDGDTQSIPGWQNRAFANIVRPIIPQRLEIMLVQLAFSPLRIPSLKRLSRREKSNIHSETVENPNTDGSTSNQLSLDGGSSWSSFKPQNQLQPIPRFLKLQEDESEEVETKSEESNNGSLVDEESSSSSQMISDTANSTKGEVFQKSTELDTKAICHSDTTFNIPNTEKETEDIGIISEIEPDMIEQKSEPSIKNHGEQRSLTEERVAKLNGANRVENRKASSPPKQENNECNEEDKARTPSKYDNEKIYGGNNRMAERVERQKWFGYDVDEDDTFSTILGPVTFRERREAVLPKRTKTESQTISV